MTRFALLGDTHGELTALEAVLGDLRRQTVDEVIITGDLLQGGPSPVEVLDRITAEGWPSVRGNSDDFQLQLAEGHVPEGLPESLIDRGRWSNERLGRAGLDRLRALPFSIERTLPDGSRLLVAPRHAVEQRRRGTP